jgi:hypothetical protein
MRVVLEYHSTKDNQFGFFATTATHFLSNGFAFLARLLHYDSVNEGAGER